MCRRASRAAMDLAHRSSAGHAPLERTCRPSALGFLSARSAPFSSSLSRCCRLRCGQWRMEHHPPVHYCQMCDDSHLMDPTDGGRAICPRCGSIDEAAARTPLLVVTGASGAGKSTLFPMVANRLRGESLVFDADWLIDPLGGDVTTLDWVMLRDIWLHVAHGASQNGLPTLLLGAFTPDQFEDLPGRRWVSDVRFLLLDCSDDARRARIDARPAGRTHDVEPQVDFGQTLRTSIRTAVDTTSSSPAAAADQIASWARRQLTSWRTRLT